MAKRSLRTRVLRSVMALAMGGSAFQLSGCDSSVRTTLLDGLEATSSTLTNALISAFFQSLDDGDDGANITTT
jgi:hypothetical protein